MLIVLLPSILANGGAESQLPTYPSYRTEPGRGAAEGRRLMEPFDVTSGWSVGRFSGTAGSFDE